MAVIATDEWLDENFYRPERICEQILGEEKKDEVKRFYEYLRRFGMYTATRRNWSNFLRLKDEKIWRKIEKLFQKYKTKWNGPDIPIYIFPIHYSSSLMSRNNEKSGVTFQDKMIIFLSPTLNEMELEALFVHEYHHACRLHFQKKDMAKYTLLDSIILEGLAEYVVEMCCGEKYIAPSCSYYTEEELKSFWNKYVKDHLQEKKNDELHDILLFGYKYYPKLLGYSIGYKLVKSHFAQNYFSAKISFLKSSKKFLNRNFFVK